MTERKDKILELVSDVSVNAVDWDLQIARDKQKYSGWFLAFSTGGLALIAARFDALVKDSWITAECAFLALVLATAALLTACIFGIAHHYFTNEIIANHRRHMTLILGRKCKLFLKEHEFESIDIFAEQIWDEKHLDEKEKELKDDIENENCRYEKWSKIMLRGQQALAGLGYLLLLGSAIERAGT